MVSGRIDGEDVLYQYFKKRVLSPDSADLAFVRRMILELSIWLPLNLYERLPVLLPYVVRDPTCRKGVNKVREEWGSCDAAGFFRDDNSLIKGIPRKFRIISNSGVYSGAKMDAGFVASHIWRKLEGENTLASRIALTNSFIPNLVWLPKQIAKLTDREGSFAQKYLQNLSYALYSPVKLPAARAAYVDKIWRLLPRSQDIKITNGELKQINFFEMPAEEAGQKVAEIQERIELIRNCPAGKKLHCSRYLSTYSRLPTKTKANFLAYLDDYVTAIS